MTGSGLSTDGDVLVVTRVRDLRRSTRTAELVEGAVSRRPIQADAAVFLREHCVPR